MFIFSVPALYPWILVVLTLFGAWMQVFAMMRGAKSRINTFNADFMKQFEEEHLKWNPNSKLDPIGNPDQGNGWYAKKLPLDKWFKFNSYQRAQANLLEWMPVIYISTLISGL